MEFNHLLDKSWKFHTRTCWNITYLTHSLLERFWLASHYIMYIILWKSRILNYFFLPKYSWISTSLISKFISFSLHVWTSRINGWTVWNKLHTGQNDGPKLKVDAVCLLGTLENVVYTGFVFMYVCVTVTSNHLPCPHRDIYPTHWRPKPGEKGKRWIPKFCLNNITQILCHFFYIYIFICHKIHEITHQYRVQSNTW